MEQDKLLSKEEIIIPVDKVQKEFDEHLSISGNDKILFSGKYGIGKSYFLDCYFESDTSQKKHNTITLSPVNYVVSTNEDIFELIKVDIIRQLFLSGNLHLTVDKRFLSSLVVSEFGKKKIKGFIGKPIRTILDFASKLSKVGVLNQNGEKAVSLSVGLLEEYSKFEEELNLEYKTNDNVLSDYAEEKYQAIGTYIENNLISQAITNSLVQIKGDKENVLIIEDFDRIDPAHIFRVLNILSAHHNEGMGNKFGFDKVVIVCDLNNIESLYKHLYGATVDFEGYIDKFYSIEPFHFDNRRALKYFLQNALSLKFKEPTLLALSELLFLLISNGDISLRALIKTRNYEFVNDREIIRYDYKKGILNAIPGITKARPHFIDSGVSELSVYSSDNQMYIILEYLKTLFGSEKTMLDKLEKYLIGEKSLNYLHGNWVWILGFSNQIIASKKDSHSLFFSEVNTLSPARFSFYGTECILKPIWSQEKTYDRNTSYYYQCEIICSPENSAKIEIKDFVSSIKNLIRFYKDF